MPEQQLGQIIDALGAKGYLDEGDLPTAAVVLIRVVGLDGQVGLTVASSEALSWIDQLGMVAAADNILRRGSYDMKGGSEDVD